MAANPSSYDPEACVFNTEETYWVQRQSGWLYSLLSQGADQRWNNVSQIKMNSQCQNDEIKLLIFLFCWSVVSLLSIAVQWNSVVSTWRFSFILMQRLETTVFHVCGLLVGDISFVTICTFWKLTLITLNSLWNNFGHVLNDWNLFSIVGQWLLKNVIYDLWKSASLEAFYSPLFAMVHYFFDPSIFAKTMKWSFKHICTAKDKALFWASPINVLCLLTRLCMHRLFRVSVWVKCITNNWVIEARLWFMFSHERLEERMHARLAP